jgi:hypothetical protein
MALESEFLKPVSNLAKIAANFHPRIAMARGVLMLDENLLALQQPLEQKNFKVYTVKTGMKDEQIAPLLAHRIFVTNNAKDFRESAAVYEFSIIDTANALQDPQTLARQISDAWIQMSLKGKQPFILRLMKQGDPVLEQVE